MSVRQFIILCAKVVPTNIAYDVMQERNDSIHVNYKIPACLVAVVGLHRYTPI
jgi:hypothetical protein